MSFFIGPCHLLPFTIKFELPAHIGQLPTTVGEPSSGSLSADQWLTLALAVGPIAVNNIINTLYTTDYPVFNRFPFLFLFFIYPIYCAKMYIYVTRTIGCVDSERAVARSVTVLFLLGLWLFTFPALVWGAIGGDFVYNYSR